MFDKVGRHVAHECCVGLAGDQPFVVESEHNPAIRLGRAIASS
jgi:hypothetical protein